MGRGSTGDAIHTEVAIRALLRPNVVHAEHYIPFLSRKNFTVVSPSIIQFMYQSMYLLYRHTHFYFNTKSANLAGGFTERDG